MAGSPSPIIRVAASSPKRTLAKDVDAITAQLVANSQSLEKQLLALREEHDALCRCLERKGVLSARELAEEAPRKLDVFKSDSPTTQRRVIASTTSSSGLINKQGALPLRRVVSPPPKVAPKVAGRLRAVARQESTPHHQLLQSKSARSLQDSEYRNGNDRATSPPPAPEAETTSTGLFECVSTLLDQKITEAEEKSALLTLDALLKKPSELAESWRGPGTPLNAVVKAGRADLAGTLIKARANPSKGDDKGVSPLHLASFDGNLELVKELLSARADVHAVDRYGQTPLFFAPSKDVCELLVDRRSNVAVLNRKGQSALHLAGRAGLHEVLDWFSKNKRGGPPAPAPRSLVVRPDIHGLTAQNYVEQSGVPRPESMPPPSPNASPHSSPGPPRNRSPGVARRSVSSQDALPSFLRTGDAGSRVGSGSRGGSISLRIGDASSRGGSPQGSPMMFTAFEDRRQSGQLPYVSELVEGSPALTAISQAVTDPRAKAQASLLDENTDQRNLDGGDQRGVVLAACMGLATAVVATAAATASSPGASDSNGPERQHRQAVPKKQQPQPQHQPQSQEAPAPAPSDAAQASSAAEQGIYDDEEEQEDEELPFLEESSSAGMEEADRRLEADLSDGEVF